MIFESATVDEIKDWIKENKLKDTGDLVFSKTTKYFFLIVGDDVVGFNGMIIYASKLVSQAQYIMPEFRGKGFFKAMLDYHMETAYGLRVDYIEATCTDMSICEYLKRGFTPVKQYKKYVKVRLML